VCSVIGAELLNDGSRHIDVVVVMVGDVALEEMLDSAEIDNITHWMSGSSSSSSIPAHLLPRVHELYIKLGGVMYVVVVVVRESDCCSR